jgi:hypothetical protein
MDKLVPKLLAAGVLALLSSCAGAVDDVDPALSPTATEQSADPADLTVARATAGLTVADAFPVGVCAYNPSDFSRIAQVGIRHVRVDRPTAAMIASAHSVGIEVLPVATGTTSDLNGSINPSDPPLPHLYAAWAKRVLYQWAAMDKPPTRIEVWNEPWHRAFWRGKPDPVAYLHLVRVFASLAWSVWPNVTLLVSADSGMSEYPTFRRDLLAADTTGFLNDRRIAPTVHTYVEARDPTDDTANGCTYDLDRFHCAYEDFKAHGHPDPRVWITEFGWESNTAAPGYSHFGAVDESEQASFTIAALERFRSSGIVAGAYAFMMKTNDNWNYNLLRPDNSAKPVVESLRQYLATEVAR